MKMYIVKQELVNMYIRRRSNSARASRVNGQATALNIPSIKLKVTGGAVIFDPRRGENEAPRNFQGKMPASVIRESELGVQNCRIREITHRNET